MCLRHIFQNRLHWFDAELDIILINPFAGGFAEWWLWVLHWQYDWHWAARLASRSPKHHTDCHYLLMWLSWHSTDSVSNLVCVWVFSQLRFSFDTSASKNVVWQTSISFCCVFIKNSFGCPGLDMITRCVSKPSNHGGLLLSSVCCNFPEYACHVPCCCWLQQELQCTYKGCYTSQKNTSI